MSTKISKCCVSGHLHKGTPEGKEVTIAGLSAYVTGDSGTKTILAITDVFGYHLPNVRLLADEYARSGSFRVVVPDLFDNDSIDVKHMKTLTPQSSDPEKSEEEKQGGLNEAFSEVGPWLERQKDEVVQPRIDKVIDALRGQTERLGVVGFCWGGRQALLLGGKSSKIDAVVANHPSYTEFPAAFEAIAKPCLIQVGDNDSMFPFDQVKAVKDEIFSKKQHAECIVYPGAAHGFTVRSDQNNEVEIKLKDDAANAALAFFQKYL